MCIRQLLQTDINYWIINPKAVDENLTVYIQILSANLPELNHLCNIVQCEQLSNRRVVFCNVPDEFHPLQQFPMQL